MNSFFQSLLALVALVLPPSLAHAGVQSTSQAHVAYAGDGYAHFDVECFQGDPSTLTEVRIVIDSTESTIKYAATNAASVDADFEAEGGWLPGFKHSLAEAPFVSGNYVYGSCGAVTLAPGEAGSIKIGGGWQPYTVNDPSCDFDPWTDANAPGEKHRMYVKSWAWASFSDGLWSPCTYAVRVRHSIHVEYVTSS